MTKISFPKGLGANCENALKCFFDLSPLDIRVYKDLLENGPATALEIGERISRDRSTAYRSVMKLVNSELVKKHLQHRDGGGILHVYAAVPTGEVQTMLRNMVDEWHGMMVEVIERTARELGG